jgi:VCBS repeat-containing protein
VANAFFSTTAGSSVAGLDLNADGINDTAQADFSAEANAGTVTVVYGNPGGFDASVDLTNLGSTDGFALTGAEGDEFGFVLASATNLTGNGTEALLIGARAAGTVSVVFSNTTTVGFTVTGLPTLADGMSLTGIGDFNGDGIGDFAIGAPEAGDGLTFPGAVYVIYGSNTLTGTLDVSALDGTNGFVIEGFDQTDNAGAAIAGTGDLNGDGFDDLLIGAPGYDDAFNTNSGTAFIVYGSGSTDAAEDITNTDLDITTFVGSAQGAELGSAVGAGQDVNGDGIADLILGAPLADPNGASSGVAHVVFGTGPTDNLDLGTLDGTDGFTLEGLAAGDQLGAAVQMLGDVTGDGIGDIGVLTRSGDLYIVYGSADDTGGSVDLSMLDGTNGIVMQNVFEGDANTQVTLTALGDVNGDTSGAIGDIGIAATGLGGAPLASLNILGGLANFAALQAAAAGAGGTIDFSAISGDVEFAGTNVTITVGGDTAEDMTEDDATVSGTLTITDSTGSTTPVFANDSASGALGMFVVVNNIWTYTLNTDLQSLDAGDFVTDSASLTADNGTQQEVTVTIQGLNDNPFAVGDIALTVGEDTGKTIAGVTLTDFDEDDSPSLAGAFTQGTYGKITVDDAGGFSYVITNPFVQDLGNGETLTDSIALTASDGSVHTVVITLSGATEGISLNFDNTPNTIITSFGDDIINAFGGDDIIDTGGGDDVVKAGTGNDVVTDTLGDDTVNGDEGNDTIILLSGNNIVDGGDDSDYIVTGFQNDTINGGAGDDVIKAEGDGGFLFGNNQITGGTGDDTMMGGAGIDTFIFNPGDGDDQIGNITSVTDTGSGFTATVLGAAFQTGIDLIDISTFGIATNEAVKEALAGTVNTVLFASGGNTVFDADGTSIVLHGVSLGTLEESDFIFA